MKKGHTFVICAYKEIPYLEDCVKSLLLQTTKSKVIISTSTPNDFISEIAKKYKVKLVVNKEKSNHIKDFCFAYNQAHTKYVTLCHQDDIYLPQFAETIVKKMDKERNSIIAFSNYYEIKESKIIKRNALLIVKRLLNFLLLFPFLRRRKWVRNFVLSLGCSICAPTVTYNKETVKIPVFPSQLKSNIDWDTWVKLAQEKGAFIYANKPLLLHRIHPLSTTTKVIENKVKHEEDYEMFRKFWPEAIAKLLVRVYSVSEKSNHVKE